MSKIGGFAGRHRGLVTLFIVVVAIVGWWKYETIGGSWCYKYTVTVETPEGIKSGSAVHEMSNDDMRHRIGNFSQSGNAAEVKGEAVVVDLGTRGLLFMLIPDQLLFYDVFPVPNDGGATRYEGIKYYIHLKSAKATLKPSQYPTMVTFKDIKDPKTVGKVDANNLAATFGAGVKLKDITIEMTDEPVTWGIGKYLPWLNVLENKKARLNGSTSIAISTNEMSDNLGSGSFRIGK